MDIHSILSKIIDINHYEFTINENKEILNTLNNFRNIFLDKIILQLTEKNNAKKIQKIYKQYLNKKNKIKKIQYIYRQYIKNKNTQLVKQNLFKSTNNSTMMHKKKYINSNRIYNGEIVFEVNIEIFENGYSPNLAHFISKDLKNIREYHKLKYLKIESEQIGCRIKYEFYENTKSNIEKLVNDIINCIEMKPFQKKKFFYKTNKITSNNKIDTENEFEFPSL